MGWLKRRVQRSSNLCEGKLLAGSKVVSWRSLLVCCLSKLRTTERNRPWTILRQVPKPLWKAQGIGHLITICPTERVKELRYWMQMFWASQGWVKARISFEKSYLSCWKMPALLWSASSCVCFTIKSCLPSCCGIVTELRGFNFFTWNWTWNKPFCPEKEELNRY